MKGLERAHQSSARALPPCERRDQMLQLGYSLDARRETNSSPSPSRSKRRLEQADPRESAGLPGTAPQAQSYAVAGEYCRELAFGQRNETPFTSV